MKNFLIALLLLATIAMAQDTCHVFGNIYENESGGYLAGNVICTTHVYSGEAYIDKDTTWAGTGIFSLKFAMGSHVRVYFIKEGWQVGGNSTGITCDQQTVREDQIAIVRTFTIGHGLSGGAVTSINGDTLFDALVISKSKTLSPEDIRWYEDRDLPYDWSGKIDTLHLNQTYGYYGTEYPYGWSGTLTAVLDGYTFSPESYTIDTLKDYDHTMSFIGTPATSISNHITPTKQITYTNNPRTYNIAGQKILKPRKLRPIIHEEKLMIKDR